MAARARAAAEEARRNYVSPVQQIRAMLAEVDRENDFGALAQEITGRMKLVGESMQKREKINERRRENYALKRQLVTP